MFPVDFATFGLPINAGIRQIGLPDIEAPVILSLTMKTSVVDTGSNSALISVLLDYTDDVSGLQ